MYIAKRFRSPMLQIDQTGSIELLCKGHIHTLTVRSKEADAKVLVSLGLNTTYRITHTGLIIAELTSKRHRKKCSDS